MPSYPFAAIVTCFQPQLRRCGSAQKTLCEIHRCRVRIHVEVVVVHQFQTAQHGNGLVRKQLLLEVSFKLSLITLGVSACHVGTDCLLAAVAVFL
jgi:hypothetical protein